VKKSSHLDEENVSFVENLALFWGVRKPQYTKNYTKKANLRKCFTEIWHLGHGPATFFFPFNYVVMSYFNTYHCHLSFFNFFCGTFTSMPCGHGQFQFFDYVIVTVSGCF
jgi:hypothetical protein